MHTLPPKISARLWTSLFALGLVFALALAAGADEVESSDDATSASFDLDWPGFRGPAGDGAAAAGEADWPESARFEEVWKRPLGPSYSGIVVADGQGFVAYGEGEKDWLLAFDTETGVEDWRVAIGELYAGHDGSHDGPVATPTVADGRVFALAGHGRLVAVDAASGEELWVRDLAELGEAPFYGFSSSPLAVADLLLVGVSTEEGPSLLALDPATGETRWSAGDDQVSYQSPVAFEIDGSTHVVMSGNHRLFGIDPASGDELWRYDLAEEVRAQGQASNVPLPLGDDRLLVKRDAFSHTAIRIAPAADEESERPYDVEELWTTQDLARTYVPPVGHDGVIFGYKGGFLVAVSAADGERLWRSRPPGDGFLTRVGDDLVVITKRGELVLADASAEGWQPKAETPLFDSAVWAPVTVADGVIYARSMDHLSAVAVRPAEAEEAMAEWPGSELPDSEFARFLRGLEVAEDRNAEIETFFSEVETLPVVEGEWVHFIYRGEAESVGLTGDMLGDRVEGEMVRVPGTDLFYSSHKLPADAWISYRFVPGLDADPVPDPKNPVQAAAESDDDAPASVVAMPGLEPPPYLVDEAAERGRVVRYEIPISADDEEAEEAENAEETEEAEEPQGPPQPTHRVVEVYVPADLEEGEEAPVVFVFLGDLARRLMDMDPILHHLIGDELPSAYVVFVHRQVGQGYFDVFPGYDAQKDVFFDDVVPFLEAEYPLSGERSYVGAGFGAFLAGRMALEEPAAARRVALVQPFWLDRSRGLVMEKARALAELLAEESGNGELPAFYLERSHFDLRAEHEGWNAGEQTARAAENLTEMGFPVRQAETNMGYDWGAWRWRMGHALAFALTGDPLAAQPAPEAEVADDESPATER